MTGKNGERERREIDRGASRGDGKHSHPLSACPASTWGPKGGRGGEGRRGVGVKNRLSLSSLQTPILFSGFPFHEEIVGSRVTLPLQRRRKECVCLNIEGHP